MDSSESGPLWRQLMRFSRRVTDASEPREVAELLVADIVSTVPGAQPVVLEVDRSGTLRVTASAGLTMDEALDLPADLIGPELGGAVAQHCGHPVEGVTTYPLVSSHDLYGALVLFLGSTIRLTDEQREHLEAMVDLAGVALGKALQYQRLKSAFDQLESSKRQLVRSEKLRALGQLAASISHDIKNVLNPLTLQLTLLRRRVRSDPEKAEEIVSSIEGVVKHGVEITNRLRDFGRDPGETRTVPVALDEAARNAIALCGPLLGSTAARVEVVEQLSDGPDVLLSFSEAVAALVNLLVNAVDAMPGGGAITVRTGHEAHSSWVEVEDTGVGMPPEVRERAFEAFYSTKGDQGTGLGLAMVQSFAARYGGEATVDSEPGRGTRFRLSFPVE